MANNVSRMKFERTQVFNFDNAIYGMRNPLDSWDKSDSKYHKDEFKIGNSDMELIKKLIDAGTSHRKILRQILVSVQITAPLYWYSQFDQYKVSVITNSTSTMHTLTKKEIKRCDFQTQHIAEYEMVRDCLDDVIDILNRIRVSKSLNDIEKLKVMKSLLPSSYLQSRMVTMNYENIFNMVDQRHNHRLPEWNTDFMNWVKTLPYGRELLITPILKQNAVFDSNDVKQKMFNRK